ncbi:NADP-dependent oxidoreductase [Nonomuraea sp. NPDC049637]|uniref:NADP-dependent oxidoreductase n=1 Tax=Nonomuraea sp. NPDC049637 TaxID=3154356 RepID=UPI00343C4CE0
MSEHVMRAVTVREFGGPEVLTVEEVARPEPLPTEVLVRVHAAGVNPVDWKTREGQGMAGLQTLPLILGWDVSGVVEEVGFGVTTLAPGDEVYAMPWFPRAAGGYAEYVDYTATRFEDAAADVDVVIDLVGDAHDRTSTRSLKVLRPGGLLVTLTAGVSPELAQAAEAAGVRVTPYLVEPDGAALATIAGLIDAGEVAVEVAETFPLEQAGTAHARLRTGRTRGKLVLTVTG